MLFRALLIVLLIYLAIKVWRLLVALVASSRPPVQGSRQSRHAPLDLEGKDVEDAKFREINEEPPTHPEDKD
ncbi:MAG: hypothetical protein ACUVTG_03040 [Candidatus Oleimicrobiaceae bacterium]